MSMSRTHRIYLLILLVQVVLGMAYWLQFWTGSSATSLRMDSMANWNLDLRESRQPETDSDTAEERESRCRVQFVSAGTYSNYNMEQMAKWIQFTREDCALTILRDHNPAFLAKLGYSERYAFDRMAVAPIVRSDFMKFLAVYYLGGLVADFDVEPVKMYPDQWLQDGCDVHLGVEHECYEGDCLKDVSRPGQIQTWSLWSRHRYSPFLRKFIDHVVAKSGDRNMLGSLGTTAGVQNIAGSGALSDYLRHEFLRQDYLEMPVGGEGIAVNATLRNNVQAVLRIPHVAAEGDKETVCILGAEWTSWWCNASRKHCLLDHHFEGTWKS